MPRLSKSEIQILLGKKQVSKSYQNKLRPIFKKISNLLDKKIPLINTLFPFISLTEFSKEKLERRHRSQKSA
jgi:hypothetical protein